MATLAKRNSINDDLVIREGIEDYHFILEDNEEGKRNCQYDDNLDFFELGYCRTACFECPFYDTLCWLWAW